MYRSTCSSPPINSHPRNKSPKSISSFPLLFLPPLSLSLSLTHHQIQIQPASIPGQRSTPHHQHHPHKLPPFPRPSPPTTIPPPKLHPSSSSQPPLTPVPYSPLGYSTALYWIHLNSPQDTPSRLCLAPNNKKTTCAAPSRPLSTWLRNHLRTRWCEQIPRHTQSRGIFMTITTTSLL